MEVPTVVTQKKTLIIEVLILIAFLGGGYYGYTTFFTNDVTTKSVNSDANLGPNFKNFVNITTKDKVSFKEKDLSFLRSSLVGMLVDYSETISPNATRGRLDPFVPYASSRPLR